MAEQITAAQFCQNLGFPKIFKSFKIAVQPARFLTAFVAVIAICATGWIMDCSKSVVTLPVEKQNTRALRTYRAVSYQTELDCFLAEPDRVKDYIKAFKNKENAAQKGLFSVWANFALKKFNQAAVAITMLRIDLTVNAVTDVAKSAFWAVKFHTAYTVIFSLIAMAVVAIAGAAICRGAAMQFSKDEIPSIVPCLKFSIKKFISMFCALLAPFILVASFGFIIILLIGLMANIPFAGEIILALLFFIILFTGIIMAFVIIWAITGGVMMFGAMGYESSDTFDLISRTFIYLYSKPWTFGFYAILAAGYGAVCYLFVRLFAFITLIVSRWFLDVIMWAQAGKDSAIEKIDVIWPKPEFFNLAGNAVDVPKRATEHIVSAVAHFEVLAVAAMVMAIAMSLYFTLSAIIYCLMRNKIDQTAMNEVFIETVRQTQEQQIIENDSDSQEIEEPQKTEE